MEIINLKVGSLETNCYVLVDNDDCLVVDPGEDADFIKEQIGDKHLLGILLTHHHFDHVGALKDFPNVQVFDHENLNEHIDYVVGSFKFSILTTPGHTPDSITFLFADDKCLFTGDFLFKETIGRIDLPGGNEQMMINSLKKIVKLNGDYTVYPGHDDKTTLESEKKNNQYVKEYGLNE